MTEPKHESRPDQSAQVDKFRDLARELECDDDEAAFDEKLKKLAKQGAPTAEPTTDNSGR